MNRIPVIDMTATGINITRLRVSAGLTVKDLQDTFGFKSRRDHLPFGVEDGTIIPSILFEGGIICAVEA